MDIDPVIIVNENGVAHLGFEFGEIIFTHERCNVDDIKRARIYTDAEYINGDKALPVSARGCDICWQGWDEAIKYE